MKKPKQYNNDLDKIRSRENECDICNKRYGNIEKCPNCGEPNEEYVKFKANMFYEGDDKVIHS